MGSAQNNFDVRINNFARCDVFCFFALTYQTIPLVLLLFGGLDICSIGYKECFTSLEQSLQWT